MTVKSKQIETVPFFSTGTYIMMLLMGIGFSFGLARFLTGLGGVTNLDNSHPWGIWIAIDVACGVVLAAGGFTTAALIEIFGRKKYHELLKPAILTAWLGYSMVGFALLFDLGRFWNIWRPIFNWQGNSVLFEVGMCVMAYITVLSVEMAPTLLSGISRNLENGSWASDFVNKITGPIQKLQKIVRIVMPVFVIAGVVLSCMHQSSLGALMVIAPSKLNAIWFTPFLPLLFLLSAIMVGFPMVILESLIVSKSFKKEPEMELLAPLARIVPVFIAIYATLKFGDMIYRWEHIDFFARPGDTTAFIIEVVVGIFAPFLLLLSQKVRESPKWLMFSASLVIFGVVINRLNVFLVGYHPNFSSGSYFPAIGEIALTLGMVATIMFLYRFFAYYFPILPGAGEIQPLFRFDKETLKSWFTWGWLIRGSVALLLVCFVFSFTFMHYQARAESQELPADIDWVKPVSRPKLSAETSLEHYRPGKYSNLYVMNNPLLNSITDYYEPVKFTHRTHDVTTGGNCALCHHRFSYDESDRIGEDVVKFHEEMVEVQLGGACESCHDMNDITINSCDSCHGAPEGDSADNNILGLKGAYHRQCIGCHENSNSGLNAPLDCKSCHYPYIPDHTGLLDIVEDVDIAGLSGKCLSCHKNTIEDIMNSAHWKLEGHASAVSGYEENAVSVGNTINNYMICSSSRGYQCATCHIGFGWTDSGFDFEDSTRIDCFVCHDTTGEYRKAPNKGGMPLESVNLVQVAERVGRPGRENCGSCHFYSDGGANVKHGDLEPALVNPTADFDIHMGKFDMRCQDCHKTSNHQIAGRSMSSPAFEGKVECKSCHGTEPHGLVESLGSHLDKHTGAIACETCHIPTFAKETPTRVFIDYSKAGQDIEEKIGKLGKPLYEKKLGEQKWELNLIPVYRWYSGSRKTHLLGDKITSSKLVSLNYPLGDRLDPSSKISPFKIHEAVQPYDSQNNILAVPMFQNSFWKHFDWGTAINDGMSRAGLKYSGKFDFIKTEMYTAVRHEVVPAKSSLKCVDCHSVEAVSCDRCHRTMKDSSGMKKGTYGKPRLDFRELGYRDDPAYCGSRFTSGSGKGRPVN